MSDDLVKRLREGDEFEQSMLAERAADRIEELEARIAKADALAEAASYMLGRIYLYSGDHDDKLVLDGMKAIADYRKAGT